MRLLFLTPQLPYPPHKGTTIRNFNLIAGLAQRHTIDVLAFVDPGAPQARPASPLDEYCRQVIGVEAPSRSLVQRALTTLLSSWPDMALRLWSPHFAGRLATLLRATRYDVVQIEGIEMARYSYAVRRHAPGALLVFDDHNAEWLLQQRTYEAERQLKGWSIGAVYSRIQAWKLARFERAVCRAADRVLAVSEADAAALRRLDTHLPLSVVTNGIDTAFYRTGLVPPIDFGCPALVFSGTMDFRPNVDAALWFVEYVLPRVRARRPDVKFVVVGQRPHARLDALRARPDVIVTGAVDDVRPYLAGAAACVVPLRMGGGTRLKVLEAMAVGAPMVSTSMGVDGFEVEHARELLIADEPDRFAEHIGALLEDKGLKRDLVQRATAFVAAGYDWKSIVPKLEEVYRTTNV